jgi:hypothetical protein
VDDTSELAVAANMPTTSEYAYPDTYWGSGPFLNGIETANAKLVTGQVVSGIKGSQGMELRSRLYGDPLVVPHGAISPGGGAAQFDVGETLTSSSGGSATILESKPTTGEVRLFDVTGTFLNGDTLTMTTGPNSGANATQSAASSGGLADKTVRFRYFLDNTRTLGVPATGICTLVPGSNNKGSIVGNEVQGLIAEYLLGINPGTIDVEWDFLTDGVAEAAVAAVKLEVVRP